MEELLSVARTRYSQLTPEARKELRQKARKLIVQQGVRDASAFWDEHCGDGDGQDFLRAAFLALEPITTDTNEDNENCAEFQIDLIQHVIEGLDDNIAKSTIDFVCSLIHNSLQFLTGRYLAKLCEVIVSELVSDATHSCSILKLLPEILTLLRESGEKIEIDGKPHGVECDEFQRGIVQKIGNCSWKADKLPGLMSIFREIQLSQQEEIWIIDRCLLTCKKANLQDLPGTIYQLLQMNGKGSSERVLRGMVELFNFLETRNESKRDAFKTQLLEVEGTFLYHATAATKSSSSLTQEWLKVFKSGTVRICPLSISLMLAMSTAYKKGEEGTLGALKKAAWAVYGSKEAFKAAWLSKFHDRALDTVWNLEESFMTVLENSTAGWEGILPPMIKFACMLIEDPGISLSDMPSIRRGAPESPNACAVKFSVDLLVAIFEHHESTRDTILNTCHCKLKTNAVEKALPFVWTLSKICREEKEAVTQRIQKIKDIIQLLPLLDWEIGIGVIFAIWPVCSHHRDLQNALAMVVRKFMCHKEANLSLMAVRGYVYGIVHCLHNPVDGAGLGPSTSAGSSLRNFESCSSQMTQSELQGFGHNGGNLCPYEFTSNLQKCLKQQAVIKEELYEGLHAILNADPTLQSHVEEMLMPYFLKYCNDLNGNPLKTELCVAVDKSTNLEEPLHCLLGIIQRMVAARKPTADETVASPGPSQFQMDEDGAVNTTKILQEKFASLRSRLNECSLEEIGFDPSTPFTTSTPEKEAHYIEACMFLGCLEVVMQDVIAESPVFAGLEGEAQGDGDLNELAVIFNLHNELYNQLKCTKLSKKQSASKKRSREASSSVLHHEQQKPAMSPYCLKEILVAIAKLKPDEEQQPELLKSDDFQAFALRSTLNFLGYVGRKISSSIATSGVEKSLEEECGGYGLAPKWEFLGLPIFMIARDQAVQRGDSQSGAANARDRGQKDTFEMSVECLEQLMRIVSSKEQLAAVLMDIPTPNASDIEGELYESLVTEFVNNNEDDKSHQVIYDRLPLFLQIATHAIGQCRWKVVEMLLSVLSKMEKWMGKKSLDLLSYWALQTGADPETQGCPGRTVRSLMEICIRTKGDEDLHVAKEIAQHLQSVYGTEQEDPLSCAPNIPVLNEQTASAVSMGMLEYFERSMTEIEWLLTDPRGPINPCDVVQKSLKMEQIEDLAWERMDLLAQCLEVFTRCIQDGPEAPSLSKCLQKFYKVLGTAVQIQMPAKGKEQRRVRETFKTMAATVHKFLSPGVYKLMTTYVDVEGETLAKSVKARIEKQRLQHPQLIYYMEVWEKKLMKLGGLANVNLMRGATRTIGRDFKIKMSQILSDKDENDADAGNIPIKHELDDDEDDNDDDDNELEI